MLSTSNIQTRTKFGRSTNIIRREYKCKIIKKSRRYIIPIVIALNIIL